jgi:hypothetical protein
MEKRKKLIDWASHKSTLVVFVTLEVASLSMFIFVTCLSVWQSELILGPFCFLINPWVIVLHVLSKKKLRKTKEETPDPWNYKIPAPAVIALPESMSLTDKEKELFVKAEEATKDIRHRTFDWDDDMDEEICETRMNEHAIFGDETLTDLAHEICSFWGIRHCEDLKVHEEQYVNMDPNSLEAIGCFESTKMLIIVRLDPHFSLAHVLRILAHECMHYYMWKKQIFMSDDFDNEFFVEAALAISGFYEYVRDCSLVSITGGQVVLGYIRPWRMASFLEEAKKTIYKRMYGPYWSESETERYDAYIGFISSIKANVDFLRERKGLLEDTYKPR